MIIGGDGVPRTENVDGGLVMISSRPDTLFMSTYSEEDNMAQKMMYSDIGVFQD